jgi:hypothetical protein
MVDLNHIITYNGTTDGTVVLITITITVIVGIVGSIVNYIGKKK